MSTFSGDGHLTADSPRATSRADDCVDLRLARELVLCDQPLPPLAAQRAVRPLVTRRRGHGAVAARRLMTREGRSRAQVAAVALSRACSRRGSQPAAAWGERARPHSRAQARRRPSRLGLTLSGVFVYGLLQLGSDSTSELYMTELHPRLWSRVVTGHQLFGTRLVCCAMSAGDLPRFWCNGASGKRSPLRAGCTVL